MRKLLGQLGGTIAGSLLHAATLIFLLSPAVSHAQYGCWNGPVNPIPQNAISMSPQYWAPGTNFPVVLTSPGGYFPGPGLFWANNYVLTAASLTGGYEGQPLLADDPYVSPAALTWVNSTTITFNVTVLPGAPIENDAWLMACGALEVYIGLGAPQITPCAVPRTAPVISSISPAIWPAGVTTTVTVTGSNFIPWNDPNGCNPTILTATAPTESGGMNIVIKTFASTTQFTAAVTPLAADPAETATVTASNYDYNASPNYIPGIPVTAQIVPPPCSTPTIASVSPSTWTAGGTYRITLTGTGFTTSAAATGACPMTAVTVTLANGTVSLSNVVVASATKITATVTPAASDPTESATVTASGTPAATMTAQIDGCDLPTSETTAFNGWDTADSDPTVGMWEQTIKGPTGINFSGETIQEFNVGVGVDTCWWSGSQYDPWTTLSFAQPWTVNPNNTWGADYVGWFPLYVAYYRTQKRAPCGATLKQQMAMLCSNDSTYHNYGPVNSLGGSFTTTTVTSTRAGSAETEKY